MTKFISLLYHTVAFDEFKIQIYFLSELHLISVAKPKPSSLKLANQNNGQEQKLREAPEKRHIPSHTWYKTDWRISGSGPRPEAPFSPLLPPS